MEVNVLITLTPTLQTVKGRISGLSIISCVYELAKREASRAQVSTVLYICLDQLSAHTSISPEKLGFGVVISIPEKLGFGVVISIPEKI